MLDRDCLSRPSPDPLAWLDFLVGASNVELLLIELRKAVPRCLDPHSGILIISCINIPDALFPVEKVEMFTPGTHTSIAAMNEATAIV